MLVLECFFWILIPACMHFTLRIKYKYSHKYSHAATCVAARTCLGLHASDHFMTSQRQVRARRDFSERSCAYSDLGTSLCHIFKIGCCQKATYPQENSEWVAAFSLLSRCATCCFARSLQKLVWWNRLMPALTGSVWHLLNLTRLELRQSDRGIYTRWTRRPPSEMPALCIV